MSFFKKILKGAQSYNMFDFAVLKLTMIAASFLVAKFYPEVLSLDRWIYAIVLAIGGTHMLDKTFIRKGKK